LVRFFLDDVDDDEDFEDLDLLLNDADYEMDAGGSRCFLSED